MPTSPSTHRRLRALWLVPLVAALTALTSCGDEAHPSSPRQAVGSAVQPRKDGPAAHLLAADKMPSAGSAWAGVETADNDVQVLGPCHLTSLVDIGALASVRRTWSVEAAVPRAVQVVARFADKKSAWRAHQVLDAWQADCSGRVDGTVGPLRGVAVTTGVGQAYRIAQGDQATDLGILRKGDYLCVVALLAPATHLPQDSSVAKAAVRRIAATF